MLYSIYKAIPIMIFVCIKLERVIVMNSIGLILLDNATWLLWLNALCFFSTELKVAKQCWQNRLRKHSPISQWHVADWLNVTNIMWRSAALLHVIVITAKINKKVSKTHKSRMLLWYWIIYDLISSLDWRCKLKE